LGETDQFYLSYQFPSEKAGTSLPEFKATGFRQMIILMRIWLVFCKIDYQAKTAAGWKMHRAGLNIKMWNQPRGSLFL
jgi:hypothetical protein